MKRQPHPLTRMRGLYLWELRFHQHLHQPGDRTGGIRSGVWAEHWLPCWLHVRAASHNPEEHKVSIFLKSIKIAIIFSSTLFWSQAFVLLNFESALETFHCFFIWTLCFCLSRLPGDRVEKSDLRCHRMSYLFQVSTAKFDEQKLCDC